MKQSDTSRNSPGAAQVGGQRDSPGAAQPGGTSDRRLAADSLESGSGRPGDVAGADPEVVAAYVDEIGRYFEEGGWPRMAGRMLGALVVAEPREQTAAQLAGHLHASRGSVSTTSRLILSSRMVERVNRRGDRRDWLRLRADAWNAVVDSRTRQIADLRILGERGLALFAEPGPRRDSLEELVDLCRFLELEWPLLVERWRRDRAVRKGSIA